MRGVLAGGLGLSLAFLVAGAAAAQPAASLGRPVPLSASAAGDGPERVDGQVRPASFGGSPVATPRIVARAQSPEVAGPTLAPPYVPVNTSGVPATPEERYNSGVVTEPPPAGGS